jgi:hypothetical protein
MHGPGSDSSGEFISPVCLSELLWSGVFLFRKAVCSVAARAVIVSSTCLWWACEPIFCPYMSLSWCWVFDSGHPFVWSCCWLFCHERFVASRCRIGLEWPSSIPVMWWWFMVSMWHWVDTLPSLSAGCWLVHCCHGSVVASAGTTGCCPGSLH